MKDWTDEDLWKLDAIYAEKGIHLHQRPFRAARDLLGPQFSIGLYNEEFDKIVGAYRQLIPEVSSSWPGSGIGLIASIDQVRKVTLAVQFGSPGPAAIWEMAGFQNDKEWLEWCRKDSLVAASTAYACADMHDFIYGLNTISGKPSDARNLWKMARSNLEDIANILPTSFSVESVTQPVCMVAELAMKACLVWHGWDINALKGNKGHDLVDLAEKMYESSPHRDDSVVTEIVSKMPPYVASRYSPQGLTRLHVVKLALGAQFIAASTLRRVSDCDMALEMEENDKEWPFSRESLFPKS